MSAERFFTHPLGILISAICATLLWGSAFPFIKLGYNYLGIESGEIGEQMLFAGYRFFLAGLMVLLFFYFIKKPMKFLPSTFLPVIKIGLYQTFLQYVLFYIGLSMSTGIQGSIIAGTTSFFQMLLAHFMYPDDKLNTKKILGLVVGFSGVIAVNLTKNVTSIHFGIGDGLLLLAMLVSGYGNILAKEGTQKLDVGYVTAYQMIFGALGLLIIGIVQVGAFPFHFTFKSLFTLLYLAFLSATGFVLWNNVMRYNAVGKVSIYLFLTPVFGVFLSSALLGEKIHFFVLVGLTLVATGIIIVNQNKSFIKKKVV